jgi:hypothetical protein
MMCARCGLRRCAITPTSVREYGIEGICFCDVPLPIIDKAALTWERGTGNDMKTYWNFQETPCLRGTAVVADAPEFPKYWARDLIGRRIAVVQVRGQMAEGGPATPHLYLDDRNGAGWEKVTYGRGGPAAPHAGLSIVPGSFRPSPGSTAPKT